MHYSEIMSNFDDMNVETQLQVAYSANAQLRDQIDALNRTVWSLEERLRISDEGKEDLKKFYEVAAEGVGAAPPCKLLIARWFYNTSAPTLHF